MKTFKIIKKDDLSIVSSYEDEDMQVYGGPWGNKDLHIQVEVPAELDADCVKAAVEADEEGVDQIVIVEDTDKKAAKDQEAREVKLQKIRDARDEKLKEMDHMAVDVALGSRADAVDVAAYKAALLAVTDSLKSKSSGKALMAIDSIADDISDVVWPVKP